MTSMLRVTLAGAVGVLVFGCAGDEPEGLRATPLGTGPQVVWDVDRRPLPEIPFPNDYALSLAADAPTGKRINISAVAPTEVESEFRRRAGRLDGFGLFAPISVRFDAPLNLKDLSARQRANTTFEDDAVLLLDITPGSPDYGKAHRLDFGSGWLPGTVMDPDFYGRQGFDSSDHPQVDPHDGASSLIFETQREDGKDVDGDGVKDVPNIFPADGNPWDDLLTWYERETNTLLLRPLRPLRPATRYAVVLTTRLKGLDGQAVRSPFPFVTLADQTDELGVLDNVLPQYGASLDDVAFAWTFTTQSATLALQNIRAGLYGHGPFAWLKSQFPPQMTLDAVKAQGNVYVITGEELLPISSLLGAAFGLSGPVAESMRDSYQYISHIVVGRYISPNFMVDKDGADTTDYPYDDDEAWVIDALAGTGEVGPGVVTFVCTIPKPRNGLKQPFPVTLKTNGTGIPKLGSLGYSGYHARQGLATCSIDSFGHGFDLGPELTGSFQPVLEGLGFPYLMDALKGTQIRDLDNDGVGDSGVDFWNPDPFHSRDTIRQTVVDWMQFVRLLRGFGSELATQDLDGDGKADLLGDWDLDGVPDIGTDEGRYTAWGISLGGIVTAVLAGIEPKLDAAVPQSAGGGLTDIAMRSLQSGVPQMVLYGSWGPFVIGVPGDEGKTSLELLIPHFTRLDRLRFAQIDSVVEGDWVVLSNLKTGESSRGLVNSDHAFRLSIQADALLPSELRERFGIRPLAEGFEPVRVDDSLAIGDPLTVCVFDEDGVQKTCVSEVEQDVTWAGVTVPKGARLVALTRGLGRDRQTPDFRRLVNIAQAIVDPADPAVWARHYHREPLSFDYDPGVTPGCNVLDLVTVGDPNVPVAAGVTLARAAGILNETETASFVDHGVVEGNWRLARYRKDGSGPHPYDAAFDWRGEDHDQAILFDVDDMDSSQDAFSAPSPEVPARATVDTGFGTAALRVLYIDPKGSHGLLPPDPTRLFPIEQYGVNLVTRYLVTGGVSLFEDDCLADNSCDFLK